MLSRRGRVAEFEPNLLCIGCSRAVTLAVMVFAGSAALECSTNETMGMA